MGGGIFQRIFDRQCALPGIAADGHYTVVFAADILIIVTFILELYFPLILMLVNLGLGLLGVKVKDTCHFAHIIFLSLSLNVQPVNSFVLIITWFVWV